jgi:hypothetical protein
LLIDTIKLILQKNMLNIEFYKKYISLNYVIHYKDVLVMSELEDAVHEELKENVALAMEHLGIGSVVEKIGLQKVIDAIGFQKVVDAIGLQKVVDAIGLQKVVDAIGLKNVINTIGLEYILENFDNPEEVERILQKIKINKQRKLSKPVAKQKKTTR